MRWLALLILASLCLAWPSLLAAQPIRPIVSTAALDKLVKESLQAWQAPGVALAVVHKGEVVYLQGHGVRDFEKKLPITPDTRFGIGSCTKAFTATALAILVDEKKLSWDDPVRKHVPYFRLADPLADREVTVRDLLCHRTGLSRHDLLWYRAPWSLEETVRKLGELPANHSFRNKYEYNNLTYIASGLVISSASGQPWHDFVRQRICEPTKMTGVVFTKTELVNSGDYAVPHVPAVGASVPIVPYDDDKQIRASGSLKASVRDLSKWVQMQLADGEFAGKTIVSRASLRETRSPQIPIPLPASTGKEAVTTQAHYGLGWRLLDYRGKYLVEHGGSVDGYRAKITLLPKEQLSIVVLTNLGQDELAASLTSQLLDSILGLPAIDWLGQAKLQVKQLAVARADVEKRRQAQQKPNTKPSCTLTDYVGEYHDLAYGKATVSLEKGALQLRWSGYVLALQHYHFDTFLASEPESNPLARIKHEFVQFSLNPQGEPNKLSFLKREFARAVPKK